MPQMTLKDHIQNTTDAIQKYPEVLQYKEWCVLGALQSMLEGIAGGWERTPAAVDPETAAQIQTLLKTIEQKLK